MQIQDGAEENAPYIQVSISYKRSNNFFGNVVIQLKVLRG